MGNDGRYRMTIKRKIADLGQPGDPCGIAFDNEKLHVFDRETGAAFF